MSKKLAKPLQCKKMVPAAVILPLPSDEVVSRKPPVLFEAPGAMFPRVEDRGIRVRGKYCAWMQPHMCRRGRLLFYVVQLLRNGGLDAQKKRKTNCMGWQFPGWMGARLLLMQY